MDIRIRTIGSCQVCFVALGLLLSQECRGESRKALVSEANVHVGMCDASAAVALDRRAFVVANDEDNQLRVYRKNESGPAVWAMDLSPFLEVNPAHPETDIEGAARVGDVIYWITSHGRNKEGESRESRHRFFAVAIERDGAQQRLVPIGRPYRHLSDDLANDPELRDLNLSKASRKAPKAEGALNIEGLASGLEGTLWIGFRNPIPGGRAVLVRLRNPSEVIKGRPALLGEVERLDLAGRGIREITWSGTDYVIVAGSADGRGKSRIYRWSGPGTKPWRVREIDLKDFNAEAVVYFPGSGADDFLLLSDDGAKRVDGVPCKELPDPDQRSFRSMEIRLVPHNGR